MDDDEIIDAEIVEDDLLPAVRESVALVPGTDNNAPAVGDGYWIPPGTILMALDYEQRQLIRASLAHYHDKGPRERRTGPIMDLLNLFADNEHENRCAQCDGHGKYRTMYAMEFCYCPRGVARRNAEN